MKLSNKELRTLIKEELDEGLWDAIKATASGAKKGLAGWKKGKKDAAGHPGEKGKGKASAEFDNFITELEATIKKNPAEFLKSFQGVIALLKGAVGKENKPLQSNLRVIQNKTVKAISTINKIWAKHNIGDTAQEKEISAAGKGAPKTQKMAAVPGPAQPGQELKEYLDLFEAQGNPLQLNMQLVKRAHDDPGETITLFQTFAAGTIKVLKSLAIKAGVAPSGAATEPPGTPSAPEAKAAGAPPPEQQEKITKGRKLKVTKNLKALRARIRSALQDKNIPNPGKISGAIIGAVHKEVTEFLEDPDIFAGVYRVKEARVQPKPPATTHQINLPKIIEDAFTSRGINLTPEMKGNLTKVVVDNVREFLKQAQVPKDKVATLSFPGAEDAAAAGPAGADEEEEAAGEEGEGGATPGVVTDQEAEDIVGSTAKRSGHLARQAANKDKMKQNIAKAGTNAVAYLKNTEKLKDADPEDVVDATAKRAKTLRGKDSEQQAAMVKGVKRAGTDSITYLKGKGKLDEALDERNERIYEALMKKLVKNK